MNPLIYAVLAIICVGALGFALVPSLMGGSRADKRIKAMQGDVQANRRQISAERARDARRRDIAVTLKQQTAALERRRKHIPLQDQLYQAGMEGIVLFVLLQLLVRSPALRDRPGFLTGTFLAGYGVARFIGEFFRQPDAHLGFLFAGATMGQLLSLPMIAVGLFLITRSKRAATA